MKNKFRVMIFIFIGLAITVFFVHYYDLFAYAEEGNTQGVLKVLCDSFTIPGVLMASIGGLLAIGSQGLFDSVGFTAKKISAARKDDFEEPSAPMTYADYRAEKNKKGRIKDRTLLWVGLGFLGVAIVLLMVYGGMRNSQ